MASRLKYIKNLKNRNNIRLQLKGVCYHSYKFLTGGAYEKENQIF